MSVAAHHNDWLSLVEVSGPFLALPVLVDALPGGLDMADRALTGDLWHAHAEWLDEDRGGAADPAVHRSWARYVVERVLGYESDVLVDDTDALGAWSVEVPEHETSLHATLAVRDPGATDDPPLLLIDVIPPDTAVLESSSGTGWSASPAERMEALLKAAKARLGLVTNGEQWTLVHVAEGENTGFATWYASLWREEPLTLRAFTTLLGMRRFFAVAEHETLQALLDRSREDQQGVTTQLGKQVRRAIEILIQQVDRVDHDRDGRLLEGMTEQRLYEAAVTLMMRLIFLFYAEENDLLLLGDEFYDETYAASTLREQLQATADENGEEILERFNDAWPRLLSTFRAVYAGVEHEQMRLPAYGGALFDPDRYPFLEGREPKTSWEADPANPLPIDNRTVLHLLNAIQTLEVKVPSGGRENRPLSFRALDVEQIGHVYETLLDHTAKRADDWIFGLEGTKDKEPEVPLRELEGRVDDTKELVKYLKDATGRSAGALQKRVAAEEKAVYDRWGHRWKPAFGGDEESAAMATKWGLLVREDSAESPVVVPPGHVYVTDSEQRRSAGAHYTPRSLTEEIVTHTLEPLVYEGPAEGRDRSNWDRRTPEQILDLKVCDPACGSGAFLVQACRYLAERLVETWEEHSSTEGPDGHVLPVDPEERLIIARRYVADRCLYGVDINPLATEMAKLSLWLITLQKNRPFTFLDHAVRTGDSLLGITDFETLETFGVAEGQTQLWSQSWAPQVSTARVKREKIQSFSVLDTQDFEAKTALLRSVAIALADLRLVADFMVAEQLSAHRELPNGSAASVDAGYLVSTALAGRGTELAGFEVKTQELLDRGRPANDLPRSPFHWPIEFPEVWSSNRQGFDAVLGNPPFLGGTLIGRAFGYDYRHHLGDALVGGNPDRADLVAYFLRRMAQLARGMIGLVATSTLSEGDTRRVGLEALLGDGWRIVRANDRVPWPSTGTNVIVSHVWLTEMFDHDAAVLDGVQVEGIASNLSPTLGFSGSPSRLSLPDRLTYEGFKPQGKGFILDSDEAALLNRTSSGQVVQRYLTGADLVRNPSMSSDRWIIDFGLMPLEEAAKYEDAMKLVEERVYPERSKSRRASHRNKWWIYGEPRENLRRVLEQRKRVIAIPRVSKSMMPVMIPTGPILSEQIVIFDYSDFAHLSLLSSSFHWQWAAEWGSTMGSGNRYTPSDCFETFPQPEVLVPVLAELGESLHDARREAMWAIGVGLTGLYTAISDPSDSKPVIVELRDLHVEIDQVLQKSYGFPGERPLSLGFFDTPFGRRFTIAPTDRVRVLHGLMSENVRRAKEGVGICGDLLNEDDS